MFMHRIVVAEVADLGEPRFLKAEEPRSATVATAAIKKKLARFELTVSSPTKSK
jgi:hypothetical protein